MWILCMMDFGYGPVYSKSQVLVLMEIKQFTLYLFFLPAEALQLNMLHLKYSFGQNNGAKRRNWRQNFQSNSTPVAYIWTEPFLYN